MMPVFAGDFLKSVMLRKTISKEKWWAIRDSNPGPTGYEPVALTN